MDRHERFEWDPDKARANLRKHGVSFEDAAAMLADPYTGAYRMTRVDTSAAEEVRWKTYGPHPYHAGIVIFVAWIARDDDWGPVTRIFSARRATPRERREYEAQIFQS